MPIGKKDLYRNMHTRSKQEFQIRKKQIHNAVKKIISE